MAAIKPFKLLFASTDAHYAQFLSLMQIYATTDLEDAQNSSIWKDMAKLPGRYAPPSGGVLLAFCDEAPAGCAAFAPTSVDGLAEMKRLYVRPEFRGCGIARALAGEILMRAHGAGYARVAISTWCHNRAALHLYESLGFEPCPPFKQHPGEKLVYLDRVV